MSFAPEQTTTAMPPATAAWQQQQPLAPYEGSGSSRGTEEDVKKEEEEAAAAAEEDKQQQQQQQPGSEQQQQQQQQPPLCAGCSLRITDSEFLTGSWSRSSSARRHFWHPACFRCAECGADLEKERAFLGADGAVKCGAHYQAE